MQSLWIKHTQKSCKYLADWKRISGNNAMHQISWIFMQLFQRLNGLVKIYLCTCTKYHAFLYEYFIDWLMGKKHLWQLFQVWNWGALHRVTLNKGEEHWEGKEEVEEEKRRFARIKGTDHISVSLVGTQHCSGCSTTWPEHGRPVAPFCCQ